MVECLNCGVIVPAKDPRVRGRQQLYCSSFCRTQRAVQGKRKDPTPWLPVERVCVVCSAKFLPRTRQGKFCGKLCQRKAQNRGRRRTEFGSSMYRLLLVKERGAACQRCGARPEPKLLQVHHVVPIEAGGAPDDPANVWIVCFDCHLVEHKKAPVVKRRSPVVDIPGVAYGLSPTFRREPDGSTGFAGLVVRGSQVAHHPRCVCPVCRPPKGAQK